MRRHHWTAPGAKVAFVAVVTTLVASCGGTSGTSQQDAQRQWRLAGAQFMDCQASLVRNNDTQIDFGPCFGQLADSLSPLSWPDDQSRSAVQLVIAVARSGATGSSNQALIDLQGDARDVDAALGLVPGSTLVKPGTTVPTPTNVP